MTTRGIAALAAVDACAQFDDDRTTYPSLPGRRAKTRRYARQVVLRPDFVRSADPSDLRATDRADPPIDGHSAEMRTLH